MVRRRSSGSVLRRRWTTPVSPRWCHLSAPVTSASTLTRGSRGWRGCSGPYSCGCWRATPAGALLIRAVDATGAVLTPFGALADAGLLPPPAVDVAGLRAVLTEAEQWVAPGASGRRRHDRTLLLVVAALPESTGPTDLARIEALAEQGPAAGLHLVVAGWPPGRPVLGPGAAAAHHLAGAAQRVRAARRPAGRVVRRAGRRSAGRAELAGLRRVGPAGRAGRRGLSAARRAGGGRFPVGVGRLCCRRRVSDCGSRIRPTG